MAISFNNALGIHEQALMLREVRAQVLANNLANADTPNFHARDIDFRRVLRSAVRNDESATGVHRTHSRHLNASGGAGDVTSPVVLYRVPLQASIDGNSVDEQQEMAQFARNALDFQASLSFVQRALSGLKTAIGNQ